MLFRSIAAGMLQLEKKGIFHCDLRAQNVLVSQRVGHYIAKINDFGLSKNTYDLNQVENTTFPIKWTDVQVLNGNNILLILFLSLISCFFMFLFLD